MFDKITGYIKNYRLKEQNDLVVNFIKKNIADAKKWLMEYYPETVITIKRGIKVGRDLVSDTIYQLCIYAKKWLIECYPETVITSKGGTTVGGGLLITKHQVKLHQKHKTSKSGDTYLGSIF